jgi:3-oxoacyl-[acyl-carrier protein] reductase
MREIAVVSGAAQGIGLATVKLLAERDFRVVGLDVKAEVTERAAELRGQGLDVTGYAVDITDRAALAAVLSEYPHIDVAVCAAGILLVKPFEELTEADFNRILQVNVIGVFLLAQEALKRMQAGGRIIAIASRGVLGDRNTAAYIASKSAIVGLVRAMAFELRERMINVNAVAPGFTDTPMIRAFPPDLYEAAAKREIRGRAALPTEIAPAIAFLASREASYITGQTIFVDGGKSLGGLAAPV